MLEFLLILPNLFAGAACMANHAYEANIIYCFGYLPFIWRNYKSKDRVQFIYFSLLEIMALIGVYLYLF